MKYFTFLFSLALVFGLTAATLVPPPPPPIPVASAPKAKTKPLLSPRQASVAAVAGKPMVKTASAALIVVPPPSIGLIWDTYTNAQVIIVGSTNLSTWYFKTNVAIGVNSVRFPASQQQEFFRAYATLYLTDGFWVDSLEVLTNN